MWFRKSKIRLSNLERAVHRSQAVNMRQHGTSCLRLGMGPVMLIFMFMSVRNPFTTSVE